MLENVILIFASMFYLLVNTLKPVAFKSRKDFSKYCFFSLKLSPVSFLYLVAMPLFGPGKIT